MNKLSKKFAAGIIIILLTSSLSTVLLYTNFLEKYYLYQKKNAINAVCQQLFNKIDSSIPVDDAIRQMEESNKVIIVSIENNGRRSGEVMNNEIRTAFLNKGIGFQKYWLWEEDYEKIVEGNKRIRLYKQDNLNYSLLVQYSQADAAFFAVTMIIPNLSDAFGIINSLLFFINGTTILIAFIFILLLIKKVTRPLKAFENFAQQMKNNEFIPLEVHTKDELQRVADHLNAMGTQIISYQKSLRIKNEEMEELLDNAAHDLKTPISLIQLYATGIKDGMDDGTFLETILTQNEQMSEMVNKLLFVSRIDKQSIELAPVNLSHLLQKLTDSYAALAREQNLVFSIHAEEDVIIPGSSEMLESIFANLITNAMKYSSGRQIDISLSAELGETVFSITNDTDNDSLDLSKVWNAYYVGEQSRNKKLSGTGLGLAIVRKICDKMKYSMVCSRMKNKITFMLTISNE